LPANALSTKILIYDHNWDTPEYPETILADTAAAYVAGSAFHGYAGDPSVQSRVHDAYPDKEIYFTECSGGNWSPDFGTNLQWMTKNLVIGTIRHWAKTVSLWNIALDQECGPQNGGCTDCRGIVTVDTGSGTVSRTADYYALGHFSRFVQPGAYRVASNTTAQGAIDDVAFRNPDGSTVLVAYNDDLGAHTIAVQSGHRYFTFKLPAASAASFVWK